MEECLFCRIAEGEIPAQKIYEDSEHIAFLDINPRNPGHTLVMPKKHYETVLQMPDHEAAEIFKVVKKMAIAVKKGMKADGVSIAQSNERAAGQVIPHVHFHVIPRFLSEGPPGLESMLPTKKLSSEMFAETTKRVMANISLSHVSEEQPKSSGKKQQKEEEDEEEDFFKKF